MEKLLTIEGVAEYLAVSRATIYRLLKAGNIPHKKVNGHYRFKLSEINEWIEVER